MNKYFKRIKNSEYDLEWKSKGMSDESIKSPSEPKNYPDPSFDYYVTYNLRKIVNLYIVYEMSCL